MGVLSWLQSTTCAPPGPRRGLRTSRQHPARWVGLARRCPSAQGRGAAATPQPTTGPGWLQSGSLLASAVSSKSCSCLFARSDIEIRTGAVPHPTRGKEERSLGGWVYHPPAASARPAEPCRNVGHAGKVNPPVEGCTELKNLMLKVAFQPDPWEHPCGLINGLFLGHKALPIPPAPLRCAWDRRLFLQHPLSQGMK